MSIEIPVETEQGVKFVESPIDEYTTDAYLASPTGGSFELTCKCGRIVRTHPKCHMKGGNVVPYTTEEKCACGRNIYSDVAVTGGRVSVITGKARFRIPLLGWNLGRVNERHNAYIHRPAATVTPR